MFPDIEKDTGIRTHNPRRQAAADSRFRKLGHWDQQAINSSLPKVLRVISYSAHFCGYKEIRIPSSVIPINENLSY